MSRFRGQYSVSNKSAPPYPSLLSSFTDVGLRVWNCNVTVYTERKAKRYGKAKVVMGVFVIHRRLRRRRIEGHEKEGLSNRGSICGGVEVI